MRMTIRNVLRGPIVAAGSWGNVQIAPGESAEVEATDDDVTAIGSWLGDDAVSVGDDPSHRRRRIEAVMKELDVDDPEQMTSRGEPHVSILEERTGYSDISGAERSEIWESIQPQE